MPLWKKYFIGKRPRGVWMYLFETTRETVDSCIADVVGDVAQDQRPQVLDAVVEELALVAHDRVGDLVDRALALVEALDQPDRRAHLVLEVVGALRRPIAPLPLRSIRR